MAAPAAGVRPETPPGGTAAATPAPLLPSTVLAPAGFDSATGPPLASIGGPAGLVAAYSSSVPLRRRGAGREARRRPPVVRITRVAPTAPVVFADDFFSGPGHSHAEPSGTMAGFVRSSVSCVRLMLVPLSRGARRTDNLDRGWTAALGLRPGGMLIGPATAAATAAASVVRVFWPRTR